MRIMSPTAYDPQWPVYVSMWITLYVVYLWPQMTKVEVLAPCHHSLLHNFCLANNACGALRSKQLTHITPTQHPHELHRDMGGLGKKASDRAHSYQSLLTQRLWLQLNHLLFCLSFSLSPRLPLSSTMSTQWQLILSPHSFFHDRN